MGIVARFVVPTAVRRVPSTFLKANCTTPSLRRARNVSGAIGSNTILFMFLSYK